MDFFSILQNNSNENENSFTIKNKDSDDKPHIDKEIKTHLEKRRNNTNLDRQRDNTNLEHTDSYKNIRKGNFVKIIGVKDSFLNSYKGYIGEIKDYKKDQDYAIVFLHCTNQLSIVKFPLYHFIIID